MAACAAPTTQAPQTHSARTANPTMECPEPFAARMPWRHRRSSLVASIGQSQHYVFDAIAPRGAPLTVRAKFTYGTVQKDLEDEVVELFARSAPCQPWESLGRGTTDEDGRVEFAVAPRDTVGRFELQAVVLGDASHAVGSLYILEQGASVTVFDIDGTLTQHDGEMVRDVVFGEEAIAHEGAVDLVRAHAAMGFQPVFITGRPYFLSGGTRDWLMNKGFASGPLFMTNSVDQAQGDDVRAYKRELLEKLRNNFTLEYAYGNASTDVCAYAEAGMPAERTFIIGPNAGTACEGFPASQPVSSYPEHLAALRPPPAP